MSSSASSVGAQFRLWLKPAQRGVREVQGTWVPNAGREDPLPPPQAGNTGISRRREKKKEPRRMRTRLLSNVDVKLPQNRAQQQSSGPRAPPISAGRILAAWPISAGAARKFPELSREGPLTWIHPPGDFFPYCRPGGDGSPGGKGAFLGQCSSLRS